MTEQIEIPRSKNKLALMLIGSLGFVTAGLWFVINPPTISNPIIGNPILILTTGIAAILFFGLCVVFLAKKLPDKTPGLIINDRGVTDNSGGVSVGLIQWSDVKAITIETAANQRFIMLVVKNPDEYISKQKGFIKKKAMQMNYNSYGSPISISANGLKCNFDELYRTLHDKFSASKA
ncbi:MAG: hypothetical protein H0W61_14780 [Bacteroidetes bacterium]|nr:hypothetical protein [Bacteroidota bacterium]